MSANNTQSNGQHEQLAERYGCAEAFAVAQKLSPKYEEAFGPEYSALYNEHIGEHTDPKEATGL